VSETNGSGVEADQSPSIAKLAEALAKAQGAIKGAKKDAKNPHLHTTYADLASVWEACREALSTNGLAVTQAVGSGTGGIVITTTLMHSSGEWMRERLHLPVEPMVSREGKKQPWVQALGSTITYGRRYALSALVGIAAEDDDGEATRPAQQHAPRGAPAKAAPKDSGAYERIASAYGDAKTRADLEACAKQVKDAQAQGALSAEQVAGLRALHGRVSQGIGPVAGAIAAPKEVAA
jgi:hypothetical protein